MKLIISYLSKSLCLFLLSSSAWAWGTLGHKASALVAWNLLAPAQKQAVNQLLNGQSMSSVAVWADGARATPEYKHTTWYHFEKVYDDQTYLKNLKQMGPEYWKLGGPIKAIFMAEELLRKADSTALDKENALKFAIHFFADLHQPLHTGRVEDNGGNKIKIIWNGLSVSLHQVWDSLIIYEAHKEFLIGLTEDEQTTAYAKYLLEKYKGSIPTEVQQRPYDVWISEIMKLRSEAYDSQQLLEKDYADKFKEQVDQRLFLAGLRMAEFISRNLRQEPPREPLKLLRKQIVEIVGDFSQWISLKPKAP